MFMLVRTIFIIAAILIVSSLSIAQHKVSDEALGTKQL